MTHVPYRDPDDLEASQRERLIDPWREHFGYVSLFRKVLLHDPDTLAAWDRYYRGVMTDGEDISGAEKEIAFVVAAAVDDCPYCIANHGEWLVEEHGYSMAEFERLVVGEFEGFTDRERAVATVAEQLARDPSGVTGEHLRSLREVGFDDSDIVELFVAICTLLSASALMQGLDVDPGDADRDLAAYAPDGR
ncbi:peroxidase-related enzyme [Natronobacterium texcoconense]|uniref:Uncharacterized peroxidase-related enzyme n=1 Tax=Natronobacterium texcoconense TaxID=1095778 RepID=A0A1H1FDS4_NATTX|nr:peroxidase-related enzyme [Natronobacterium texcoconense]SDQ98988.1 uncharacterized peroxidase-related enzyme [Natronobacterium texcoconense]